MKRSDKHKKKLKRRVIYKSCLISMLLLLVVAIGLFAWKQQSPVKDEATKIESSKSSSQKTKSSSKQKNNSGNTKSSNQSGLNSGSGSQNTNGQSNNASKPNTGKVLYFNTTDEADAAIKQHEAECSHGNEPFYPGLVYTGTYTCKCGLVIIWWDQALKEGFDNGHSDDPRVQKYLGIPNSSENSESNSSETDNESDKQNEASSEPNEYLPGTSSYEETVNNVYNYTAE